MGVNTPKCPILRYSVVKTFLYLPQNNSILSSHTRYCANEQYNSTQTILCVAYTCDEIVHQCAEGPPAVYAQAELICCPLAFLLAFIS